MKAIMILFDSLNRKFLPGYGCEWTRLPNFKRLMEKTVTFDRFYGGSLPCMPARRELHTGRYNFLHTSWSPMQPYDDSVIARLAEAGIYTHITTDHFHYLEDGGSCYLTKYQSFEMVRGQQGDPWKGQVKRADYPETMSGRAGSQSWNHDWINRKFLNQEEDMPQKLVFDNGLDFIRRNCEQDSWFLQIESFDPHEPFFSQPFYKSIYPDRYMGKNLDWPEYGRNLYPDEAVNHVRYEYAALLSMCDHYLGQVLNLLDELDMWKDTMLIVNTDHGFMLGEKGWMGKNVQPFYEEISHIPCFIHDPRNPHPGERRKSLSQTVDLVPTLAEYFGIKPPDYLNGRSLTPVINEDKPVRTAALYGIFGGHINVTDGRYVYMRAPVSEENTPLNEYTLMPCHMNRPYGSKQLEKAALADGFRFTGQLKQLRMAAEKVNNAYEYGNLLFDLETDPEQEHPINNVEIEKMMIEKMRRLMEENEAPLEQYQRVGI